MNIWCFAVFLFSLQVRIYVVIFFKFTDANVLFVHYFYLTEVALGQYLGVGGMTFIGQIVPIMKGKLPVYANLFGVVDE